MSSPLFRLIWWAVFITGALLVQQRIPGVDALAPGFLLSLQERRPWQTLWLFLLFSLIQEGTGTMFFGSSLLWYGGQAIFFWIGQRFFVADNVVFVLLLALFLGAYHALLTLFMCAMQEIPVEYTTLIHESIIQTLLIPLIWGLAYFYRPRIKFKSY